MTSSASDKLSLIQLEEIKKAFEMCDHDRSGNLDKKEVANVLRAVLNQEPTPENVQSLFSLMDSNGDGSVSLNEFVAVMADFLAQEDGEGVLDRANTEETRTQVHQHIKDFFSMYSKNSGFDVVRSQLRERVFRSRLTIDAMETMDSLGSGTRSTASDEAKLEALNFANNVMLQEVALRQSLNSNNQLQVLEAAKTISQLLSLVEVFGSPLERRSISDVLVSIFELCYTKGVMQRMAQLLMNPGVSMALQFEICNAFAYYANGPRIANIPAASVLHPSHMTFKKQMKDLNVIPMVYGLLSSMNANVREAAVSCIGSFCSVHPEARDYVLNNHGLNGLLPFAHPNQPVTMLRRISFTLSVLIGYTHPHLRLPDWNAVNPAMAPMVMLFQSQDVGVVDNVLHALTLFLPGYPEANILRRLLDILTWHDLPRTVETALYTIIRVIQMDHLQATMLIDGKILLRLKNLLVLSTKIKLVALQAIAVLAHKGFAKNIIEEGVVPTLLQLLSQDNDSVRAKSAELIRILSQGSPQVIMYLVQIGGVRSLCDSLQYFKNFDRVLLNVYSYSGASYNFEYAMDVVKTLDNILNAAQLDGGQSFPQKFQLPEVDRIKSLLQTLRDNQHETAWKKKPAEFDQLIASVLFKIKRGHDGSASALSTSISAEVQRVWASYFGKQDAGNADPTANKLYLKCVLGSDIRIVEIEKSNLSWPHIFRELSFKFHRKLKVCYKDRDGDLITIDSQGSFEAALKTARGGVCILVLEDEGDLLAASADDGTNSVKRKATELSFTPPSSPVPKSSKLSHEATDVVVDDFQHGVAEIRALEMGRLGSDMPDLDLDKLEQLHQLWTNLSAGSGLLTRELFATGMKQFGITNPLVLEQNFRVFDRNGDGHVEAREFVTALAILQGTDLEAQLRLIFDCYDLDKNGTLDKNELSNIFEVTMSARGVRMDRKQFQAEVERVFAAIDADNSGSIDFKEFVAGYKQQLVDIKGIAFV